MLKGQASILKNLRLSFTVLGRSRFSSFSPSQAGLQAFSCEKSAIQALFRRTTSQPIEGAFAVNDVGVVERQYNRWNRNLPSVRAFYAVKCNPDNVLLKALASLGSGFDCASSEEIDAVLNLGVPTKDIIFANPVKSPSDLRFAAKVGVKKMTFDNEDELKKIKQYHPDCELVLRLLPDDSGSVMRFGSKFGAPFETIESMLKLAQRLNLKVIGTSFHIGSGCYDANSYEKAISLAKDVFNLAKKLGMSPFHFLDIGGGFPGNPVEWASVDKTPSFEEFSTVIRRSLATHFPRHENPGLQIIGEPGRYMATAWSTLFTLVQGKRAVPQTPSTVNEHKKFLYYINDGVYGSFNCIMFDHASCVPVPAYRYLADKVSLEADVEEESHTSVAHTLRRKSKMNGLNGPLSPLALSQLAVQQYAGEFMTARGMHSHADRLSGDMCLGTFFGPTCDSMDVIAKEVPMEELHVGEWLAFSQMGAYTNAAASTFNGMPKPRTLYCYSKLASPAITSQ